MRSESPRHRITPGPTRLVSVPSRGAPRTTEFTPSLPQARRRGLSARRTRGLRSPFPSRVRVPGLPGRVPSASGVTPGSRASSGGGHHRETKAGVTRPGPSMDAPNTCGDVSDGIDLRLRRSGPHPGAGPAGHSPRPQPNRDTSRGVSLAGPHLEGLPPHLVSSRSRAGVPNRLLAGFDALAGRARLLAERFVDGLGFSPHEGRASRLVARGGCGSPRSVTGAVRCCRQDNVMNLSMFTDNASLC